MGSQQRTRDCFLWFMSLVYLFAFTSLYIQIPGLYGDNGVLPAKLVMEKGGDSSWQELVEGQPTLLKLMPRLGLDTQNGMDLLCLAGMVISFFCVVSCTARDFVSFTLLWMFYLSLYQVGQTFLWFQWDILLLEAGFLTIIIAPFNLQLLGRRWPMGNPHDGITMWLAKWLLFRLMFASGVVKLTSQCPTWWGLTALTIHFESQCIPTPAAWYWHHLPEWFLKLSCVATYVIEIPIPFLFFSPIRSLRIFAFWSQVMLQMLIILTGNYNFFNILTITLCIPLLDDSFFMFSQPRYKGVKKQSRGWMGGLTGLVKLLVTVAVLGYMGYLTYMLFGLKLNDDFTVSSKITFSQNQFFSWLETIMPYTVYLGAASLGLEIVFSFIRSLVVEKGVFRKAMCVAGTLLFGSVAVFMFSISLIPHTVVHKPAQANIPREIIKYHAVTRPFHLTNSYGLFRRMTGVEGRPELIIEGHATDKSATNGWRAYNFLYKPGNISEAPAVVAPHQPRLDWQMWFAALGNYQNNPWFLNLIYRLLQNEPDVLELLANNPFPDEPPKYVRAKLFHYHYTTPEESQGKARHNWWKREEKVDYLPALSLTDKHFVDYLKKAHIMEDEPPQPFRASGYVSKAILWVRDFIGQPEGFSFSVSVFGSAILAMFLNKAVF